MRVLLVALLLGMLVPIAWASNPDPWVVQTLCQEMPPIGYPDYMMSLARTQSGASVFGYKDRDNPKIQEVADKIELWAVRAVTIWYRDWECPVYASWGSAVALEYWKTDEGDLYILWATVHHVAYPIQYEEKWSYMKDRFAFDRIEIEGYDLLPIWQNNEVVFALSRMIPGVAVLKEMIGDDYVADEVYVGDDGVSLGYTVHANYKNVLEYENLYHFPVVTQGPIISIAEYKGLLGADFLADLNGMPGMSGGPYLMVVPREKDESLYRSFRLAGITNIGARSGLLGYYMLPPILKTLREWWQYNSKPETYVPPDKSEVQTPPQEPPPLDTTPPPTYQSPQGFFLPVWKYPPTYERP